MHTIIHTPTNKVETSLDFYTKLKFKTIENENSNLVTDGKVVIEINPERTARAGIKLYRDAWDIVAKKLQLHTFVTKMENGFLLSDSSGTWIYLIEGKPDLQFETSENAFSVLGNFAGLSLETTDMKSAIAIWKLLGFEKTMGDEEQGWVVYANQDGIGISLMKPFSCPHLFFNPSLTYFNGKNNLAVIQQIRDLNIPITEEITHFNKEGIVDNIIIRDPGGYGFFIFSD